MSCLHPSDQHWSDDIPSDAETEHPAQSQAELKAELDLRVSENEEEKPSDTPKQEERGGGRRNDFQNARDRRGMLIIPGEAFGI